MRASQADFSMAYSWMRAAEHASRGSCHVLERLHGLADIVERGAFGSTEHLPVNLPHHERDLMTLSEDAPRHAGSPRRLSSTCVERRLSSTRVENQPSSMLVERRLSSTGNT